LKKALKIFAIALISILLLLLIIPYLLPQTISNEVKKWVNQSIKGEVAFESTSLSFFRHFPSLTFSLHNFTLKGAAPFQQDTLLHAKELSFGVDLSTIFSDQVKIEQIFLDKADINIMVDEKGNANYNVYESKNNPSLKKDSSQTAIKIQGIFINKSNIVYNDRSIPMIISAKGLSYTGEGDLSKAIFDLKSKADIDTIDVYYNKTPYLLHKSLNARLVTKINTSSLDLLFDENDLKINSLPIRFKGKFSFLKDGYDINFKTQAKETDLHNIFSALPPEIASRMEKTNIKGYAEIKASLIGKYIAKENLMPTASFSMKIRDGEIMNPKAPEGIKNLYLNLQTKVPGLNPDSLYINMDSLYFNIGSDYVSSIFKLKGIKEPEVHINTRAAIDLEKWSKIFGIEQLRGRYQLKLHADGKYTKKIVKSGLRQVDTVIASIPKFRFQSTMKDGYFKYAASPAAIDRINFHINGSNTDGQYKSTILEITDLDVQALSNYIRGHARIQTAETMPVDVALKSMVNFAEIKSFYPLGGLELSGNLNLDLQSKGGYNKLKKKFPVTQASILLNNGRIKTASFDQPLEQIVIDGQLVNKDGQLRGTQLNIRPISFSMGGQPFLLKADLRNFDNVAYNISSKGSIDIGKLYRLFAVKGYQVKGSIYTDVAFKGLQSDALSGKYGRLNNMGRMVVKGLNLRSDLFPEPFLIKNGVFSFFQDKMTFERFQAGYGKSDFSVNGYMSNIINYVLVDKAKLTGNFNIRSKRIYADEFMAYNNSAAPSSTAPAGVIMIPGNLNVKLSANAASVYYNDLEIKDAKGTMTLDNGTLSLIRTGFNLIGAPVMMDATYKSLSPGSAMFDYHILATEFDVARAYKEIRLFREMATSAAKVKGIIGLDYQLSGKLNQEMYPVLPTLKGGGVLSVKKVSLLGFKMMNAVSKATSRDSLNNPDVSAVTIKSTIRNNIINIERFKMRIAGFRPRFEGQVSFDGRLNMSGRLGLPPFGIIGIPLSITGTQEQPKVALKRNKEGKLEETEEQEDSK